ncbi:GreA/GreB family elongation factor [Desulfobulbus propionicus DSM 2032]|uniref:GreA/GreB family elongation factor n=1 Tax=Desulfobulbus propionicus (strain ATCC 33891 / DSM 2032 / VKM B-1956 / 1pr3) TaxID=577650 RepID=A0A7U3YJP5_DESPD|nr:GreA/GreB family elongation factor [Desulfobulbus propionicus]ADW16653.1 GreA/GreB family elongation factor [Desulfobulbus propionicus DSM 2032]
MSSKTIFITEKDKKRIEQLLLFCDCFTGQERKYIRKLHYDMSQGHVVSAGEMPSNVVTTHSWVVLCDLSDGEVFGLTLVFPEEVDSQGNRVSILSSIGAALIGRQKGDTIAYSTPSGIRRCLITTICQSPEPCVKPP